MAKVIIKDRKARPFWFGHPWVFSGAVDRVRGKAQDGEVVEVLDASGKTIGEGFFNRHSQIRVRLVALAHEGRVGLPLLLDRLDRAIALRTEVLDLPAVTNAYRLVHGDGDGLPGLVVDRVGEHLVVQVSCLGLEPFLGPLLERLQERTGVRGILERAAQGAAEEEGMEREEGVLLGEAPTEPVAVTEHGVRYYADLVGGQKTGFYSDQRDNRRALAPLGRGKEVLDCFSYVGGFGLRMAQEGAAAVTLIDSSGPVLALAACAAQEASYGDLVRCEDANVLRYLDHAAKDGLRFDVVLADPPKLVRKRADLRKGLRLYQEINQKALRVLRPGGVLVTNTCSQHVLAADFEGMLTTALPLPWRRTIR